jgi:prophage antirepressor-like protein
MSKQSQHQEGLPALASGKELAYVEKDGQILFSAEEVGKQLGYGNPAEAINRLFMRNQSELKHYSVPVKLTATDGKAYETRAFSEEGVYILSMLARTNQAKAFRARVALLLRRVRQEREARVAMAARREVVQLVSALSPAQRTTMKKAVAYRAKGLTHVDIGKLLDCSHDTVRKTLRRAKALGMVEA